MVPRTYDLGQILEWGFGGVWRGLSSRKSVWHEPFRALCDVPVHLNWFGMVPRMCDLAHFLGPFRGPLGVHAAEGPRQTFIFAYARLNPVCSCAPILVPRSHDQSALGCRSRYRRKQSDSGIRTMTRIGLKS